MMEIFYGLMLVVFGALIVVTLTNFWMKSSALKEELHNTHQRLDDHQGRLSEIRAELEDLGADAELLEMEKASLEAQETCIRNLDTFSAGATIGEHRPH
jgi:chromosome segregation ATPase